MFKSVGAYLHNGGKLGIFYEPKRAKVSVDRSQLAFIRFNIYVWTLHGLYNKLILLCLSQGFCVFSDLEIRSKRSTLISLAKEDKSWFEKSETSRNRG